MEEEKRKAQERLDREKYEKERPSAGSSAKVHGKKEWQHVPFVPTVAFNTPLPQARRGGRPPGAVRGDNVPRGRAGVVDKSTSTTSSPTTQGPLSAEERSRNTAMPPPAQPAFPKPKRASSAGPVIAKEQRKPVDEPGSEGRKEFEVAFTRPGPAKQSGQPEARRQSAEPSGYKAPNTRLSTKDPNAPRKAVNHMTEEERQPAAHAATAPPFRSMEQERKSDSSIKTSESSKDTFPSFHPRDRGEGRADRGRGGYRGRGAGNQNQHGGFHNNGHAFSGGYPSQYQVVGAPQGRSFSNHERMTSPSQPTGAFYATSPPHNRNHRSNSRSQSGPHPSGRFQNNNLANLQTDLANAYAYQTEPQGPMSAMPFNPFLPGAALYGMVQVQIEYYFSVDNLCKDTYLRSHMNSQGFVPLSLIIGFRRIQQLTPDLEMIRYVCLNSHVIEFMTSEDGVDWARRRGDWQQWVLSMDERNPSARNEGPRPGPPFQHPMYAAPPVFDERSEVSPRANPMSAPPDTMQFQSLDNSANPIDQAITPAMPMANGFHSSAKIPLSAAVSEFSPAVRSTGPRNFSSPDPYSQEMEKLNITFRAKPADAAASDLPPFHAASSRTFSNGSIDGNSISQELGKIADLKPTDSVNGDTPDG